MKSYDIFIAGALMASPIVAQLPTYSGCPGGQGATLDPSHFRKQELYGRNAIPGGTVLNEPVQIALHPIKANGAITAVDIYSVGRLGKVFYYNGAAKTVSDMGTIPTWAARTGGMNDNGLMGLAIDPDFDRNKYMYFWYGAPVASAGAPRIIRLSRIATTADHKLDLASEKILIQIRGAATDTWHSGGPMQFDKHGDLWIQVGNQSNDINDGSQYSNDSLTSDEWGPPNTANMRGSTLRIHPDGSAKGYSIPAGNFGEYWAAEWDKQNKAALAAEYRNPAKVLPEVYIKGERSNYSIGVHPTKRWLAWGTVNYESAWDEFNVVDHPAFTGFPYFHANNVLLPTGNFAAKYGFTQVASAPRNMSALSTGVKDLPPAWPGAVNSLASVGVAGAVYGFDPSLDSPVKFPPHFNNTFIGFDFIPTANNPMWLFVVDTTNFSVPQNKRIKVNDGLFAGIVYRRPLQAVYGPDGALYINSYDGFYSTGNPGVTRIDYIGPCKIAVTTKVAEVEQEFSIIFTPSRLSVWEAGRHEFGLFSMDGTRLVSKSGVRGAEYSLTELRANHNLGKGVHVVKVKTGKGLFVRNVSFL